jgi:serine/threonine protein kinase
VATQRILASKYCLLYELGRGGMGSVWLAEHLTLRSKVAVKLIDPRLAADAEIRRRFEREAMAAAALRSPHVVQVLDFGIDGSPYLVMELLTGETLGARLSRGVLSPKDTWKVTSQIGRAMMRAHQQGIVHRDLKPDNIFLVEEDEDFFVKVLDFGIAKALVPERPQPTTEITRSGAMVGTPHYMSPEQAEGRAVDACSDLWSMGVIAFECITGLRPFDGSSLPAILRAICFDPIVVPSSAAPVPPGFDEWFARAAERDRSRRFQTARALVDALEPVLRDADEHATPPGRQPFAPANPRSIRTYPGVPPAERRKDDRVPSSIPAGINGERDLRHTALIHNASRNGALLATRHQCHPGDVLELALQLGGKHHGESVSAHVVRVRARTGDPIWRFDVGVRFDVPLADGLLTEIERRATGMT